MAKPQCVGGTDRHRTCNLLLAKQLLSQLSYGPVIRIVFYVALLLSYPLWQGGLDLHQRPTAPNAIYVAEPILSIFYRDIVFAIHWQTSQYFSAKLRNRTLNLFVAENIPSIVSLSGSFCFQLRVKMPFGSWLLN
jgi:hypothetical protein